MFTLNKVLVALVAVTAALAAPSKRDPTDLATCTFIMKPDVAIPSGTDLTAEFNFVIGRTLAVDTGVEIFGGDATFVANADSTFTVEDTLAVDGMTAADTAAVLTGFAGTAEAGFGGAINWLFQSVECMSVRLHIY